MNNYEREQVAKLTGDAGYVSDCFTVNQFYAAFVRSPVAGARFCGLDIPPAATNAAQVITAADWPPIFMPPPNPILPFAEMAEFPILARDWLVFVGQPIALVLADSPAAAQACADAVRIKYTDLNQTERDKCQEIYCQPVIKVNHASKTAPDSDPAAPNSDPAPPDQIKVRFAHNQAHLVAMSLEPRSILAEFVPAQAAPGRDQLHITLASQTPSRARRHLIDLLSLSPDQIRVKLAAIGGAFGGKSALSPEEIAIAYAAWRLKCSIKWTSSRSEEFAAAAQGRGGRFRAELTLNPRGDFLSLAADLYFPLGAYPSFSAAAPLRNAARILPGPYRVAATHIMAAAYLTPTPPVTIYRGAGRPEACLIHEALIDRAARALGCDPLALRRQNLRRASELPHETAGGMALERADFVACLDHAAVLFDYPGRRAAQIKRRQKGEIIGLGIGFYLEPCGQGFEAARLVWDETGLAIYCPSPDQGQGHAAAFAAIAAEILPISIDHIHVCPYDSDTHPDGIGALASRSIAIGGSAIALAAAALKSQHDAGKPFPLSEDVVYHAQAEAISHGCAMTQIAIAPDTGAIKIEKITLVDAAGRILTPALAHGQILGGIAQGIGQALMESVGYDEQHQILTGSLMDYAVPRCGDMPDLAAMTLASRDSPSPANPLGAKGVGEAGTIGIQAALYNAVLDGLLTGFAVEFDLDFPLTSEKIWAATCRRV
ncbi:MAG: xanthine dehydrogenase family protein molybdopterin-binding subunit [Candidatus Symbiobacter sp.]|nr:xanthine dehydrogenase family protein molybdopterin-binding subunit [Candidatus Symbiobacter sp.]